MKSRCMFTNDELMKNILLFVHVPKTAGTSFRKSLESQGQAKMLYDYGQHPESSPALLENLSEDGSIHDDSIFDAERLNVICGHFAYRKYGRCAHSGRVISILRNPVERIVSEYQHLVRLAGLAVPFSEFIISPIQIDKQFRMLREMDLSVGGVFGVTSHYDCFLRLVRRRFDLDLVAGMLNRAPLSDHQNRLNIPVDDINKAFQLNRKDLAFFFSIVERFRNDLEQVGIAAAPMKDARFYCRLDKEQRVVGWVTRTGDECVFVELSVNGQRRAIVGLDQERPDVVGEGLSKNPLCGFSYPLSLLGARSGDKVEVRILGASDCGKTLTVSPE